MALLASFRKLAPALSGASRAQAVASCSALQAVGRRYFAADDDSHDDFKTQFKAQASGSIADQIEAQVKGSRVFVFMKGVPEAPMCGFSNLACRILDTYELPYGSANVLADPELRDGIKKYTAWPTIPQVFIDGEFVGGADILMSMHQSGELAKLLSGGEGKPEGGES